VGYVLSMSGEIRDWLTTLSASEPDAAMVVGQALIALANAGPSLGPPVVVTLDTPLDSTDPAEALDQSYQRRLERLHTVRWALAEVADLGAQIRKQIKGLEASHSTAHAAELRRLLPGLDRSEQRLTAASQRLQAEADAFRARKETLKAKHTAAASRKAIAEVLADVAAVSGDQELTRERLTISEEAEHLEDVTAEMKGELRREAVPLGLMELRPGSPASTADGIRIIFGVEPPGTALLISVIEGGAAIRYQLAEATAVSGEVLQQVRAGLDPETAAVAFTDTQSFIAEFFPESADEVRARADALLARAQARAGTTAAAELLAGKRASLGLTAADVAGRMGVQPGRVAAIEHDADATEMRTLARYVEALGGKLEVVADFDSEQIALR